MKKEKTYDGFKDLIETGYEVQFTLNHVHYLIEPDQDTPDLSDNRIIANNDTLQVWKFKNAKELLDFEIDGVPLKKQLRHIDITDY